MILELSDAERDVLRHVLHREIENIGPEIRHTQTAGFRDDLKQEQKTLLQLYERLAPETPAT